MGGNKRAGKAPPSRGADPPQPPPSSRRRRSSSSSSSASWEVNDANSDSSLEVEKCGECGVPFNSTNHRRVKDNCGCRKCRACMAESEMECRSCKKPEKKTSSSNLQQTYNTRSKGPVKKKKLSPIPKRRKVMINTILPKDAVPGCSNKKVPPARSSPDITEETQKTKQTPTSQPSRLKLIIRKKSKKETSAPSSPSAAQESASTSEEEPIPSTSSAEPQAKRQRKAVVIFSHITVHPIPDELPTYECTICGHKFKTKANVKYHEVCLTGKFHFKCETCGQGFISKSHYEYHLRTHTGVRPFACPKCDRRFNQRSKVTRHMLTHTGEKPHKCQECSRGFANNQALRAHMLIHTGERPFPCSRCPKRFTGLTNLKKHMITHTGERPFTCDVCQKSFGLKWTLQLHQKTHTDVRPFACDKCTRSFSNKKDLRRHLITHTGLKPYKCSLCATPFRRKDNLDRHLKKVHKQPKEVAKQLGNEAAAEYLKTVKKQPDDIPASKRNAAVTENIIQNYGLLQDTSSSRSSNQPSTSTGTASKLPASSAKKKAKKKKKVDPPHVPNNEAEPLPPGNEDAPATSNKKLEEKPEEIQKAQEEKLSEEECILPHDLDELDKEGNESVAPFLASSTIIEPVEPGDEYPLGSREVVIITIQNDLGMREELPVIPVELQPPPPPSRNVAADPTVENKERWSYILESLSDNEYPVEVDEEGDKSTQADVRGSSGFDVGTPDSIEVGETKAVPYWEGNFVLDGEASLFVSAPAGLREFTVEEVRSDPVSAEASCSDSLLDGEERGLVEQNADAGDEKTEEPQPQSASAVEAVDEQHVEASQVEIVREERRKEGDDLVTVNVPISLEMIEESDLVEEESVEEIRDPFSCRDSPSPTPSELGISFDDDPSQTTLDESGSTDLRPNPTGLPSPVECNSPTTAELGGEVVDVVGSCSSASPSRDDAFIETDSRANEEVDPAPISTETAPISTETAPISTETAPISTETAPISTETAPTCSSLQCLEDEDEMLVEDEQSADLCDTEVEDQPPESIAIASAVDEHVEVSQMETEREEGREKEDLVPVEMDPPSAPDNVSGSVDEDDMVETVSVLGSLSPTPSESGISIDADAASTTLKESRRIDSEPVECKSFSARRLSVIVEEGEDDEPLEIQAQGEQLDTFVEDEQTVAPYPPGKEVEEKDKEDVQPLEIQAQAEQLNACVEDEQSVALYPPDNDEEEDAQPMEIQVQGEPLVTFVEDEQTVALSSPDKEVGGDVQPLEIQAQGKQLETFVEGEQTVAVYPPDKEDVQPLEIQAQTEQLNAFVEDEQSVALYPPDNDDQEEDAQPMDIQAQGEQLNTLVENEQTVALNLPDKEVVQPLEIQAQDQQTVAPYAPDKELEEEDVQPLENQSQGEQLDAFVENEQTVALKPPDKEVEEEDEKDVQPLEIQAQAEQLNAFAEDEQTVTPYTPDQEEDYAADKKDDTDQPEEMNIVPVSPTGVEQTESIDNTLLLNSNPEVVKLDESSERLSLSSLAVPAVESQIVHEDVQLEADNGEERKKLEIAMEEAESSVSAKVDEQTENVEGMPLPDQQIDTGEDCDSVPETEEEEKIEDMPVAARLAYINLLENRIEKLFESLRAGVPEEEETLGAEPGSVLLPEEKDEQEALSIGQEMDTYCDPVSSTEEGILKNIVTLGSHHESVPIPDIPEETDETDEGKGDVESMGEEFGHDSCSLNESVELPSFVVTVGEEEKLGNETEERIKVAVEEAITPAPPVVEIIIAPNSTSNAISLCDNAEDGEQLEAYEPAEQQLREEFEESSPDIQVVVEPDDGELLENETDVDTDTDVDEQQPPPAAFTTEHHETFQVEANGASSPVPVQINENVGEQLAIENEDESLESVEEMQFEQQEEDDGMETEEESSPQEGNGRLTALCNLASFLIGLADVAEEEARCSSGTVSLLTSDVEQPQVPHDEIKRDSAIQVAVEETMDAVVEKVVETETVDFEMGSWVQIETEVVSGEAAELEDLVLCVSPSRDYPIVEPDSEGEGKAEEAVSDDDNETVCSSESEKAPPYSPLSPYPKPGERQNYEQEGQCSISPPPQEPHVFQANAEAENEEGTMMATELPFPEENYEIVSPPTPQLTIEVGQEEDDFSFESGSNGEQDLGMISRPAVPDVPVEKVDDLPDQNPDVEMEDFSSFFWDTFTLKDRDSTGTQPEENTEYLTGFRVAGAAPLNEMEDGKIRFAVFTSKSNQVDDEKDDSDDDQPSPSQKIVAPARLYCVTNIRNKNELRKAIECLKRQRQQVKQQEEEVEDDDDDYGRLYIDEGPCTEQQDDIGFNDNPPVPINLGRVQIVDDFDGVVVPIREEGFCPYSSLPYSASYPHHPAEIDEGPEAQGSYLNLEQLEDDIEYPPQEQALDLSSESQQREMEVAIKLCALLGSRAALEREAFPNSVPLRLSLPSSEDNLEIRGNPLMTPSTPEPPPSGIDLILQASKEVELRIRARSRRTRYQARRLARLRREKPKRLRKQLEAGVADPTGIIGENTRQLRRAKWAIRPVRNFVKYTVHRSYFELQ